MQILARLTILTSGAAVLVVLLCSTGHAQSERNIQSHRRVLGSLYRTCTFPTVRTDEHGKVVEARAGTARCFDQDLGNGLQFTMIEVPEGDFFMGSPESEPGRNGDEGPRHKVHVRRFFIGQFEATDGQYEAMRKRPRVRWKMYEALSGYLGKGNPQLAVNGIAWPWAVEFCARMRKLTGREYRLPSEAEWEYATRANTTTAYTFGPVITPSIANCCGREPEGVTTVGASGPANAFGLFDVHGNAAEWVADSYHTDYSGAPTDGSPWWDSDDSRGLNLKKERVMRGGAAGMREYCRSAAREKWPRELSASGFGMRIALDAPDDQAEVASIPILVACIRKPGMARVDIPVPRPSTWGRLPVAWRESGFALGPLGKVLLDPSSQGLKLSLSNPTVETSP